MRALVASALAIALAASTWAGEDLGAWEVEVRGPDGTPVPRAEAVFVEEGPGYCGHVFGWVERGHVSYEQRHPDTTVLVEIRAPEDESGRPLPWGASLTGPHPPGALVVSLGTEHVVEGTLRTPAGSPVAGAAVCAVLRRGEVETGGVHAHGETDADGRFRLARLGPYAYRLEVDVPEGYVAPEPVAVRAGARDVVVRVRALLAAEVVVRDADGKALAGCRVRVERPAAGDVVAVTDDAGAVVLPPLDPGRSLPRWIDAPAGGALPRFEPHWFPRNETVTLARAATISGVVVDEAGAPLPDATVWIRSVPQTPRPLPRDWSWLRLPGGWMQGAIADAEGRFVVQGLPEGPDGWAYEVFAALAREGTALRKGTPTLVPGGTEGVTLRVPIR